MSKKFKIIYSVLFFLFLTVVFALLPITESSAYIEKRSPLKLPGYVEEGKLNMDFSTEFEAWINDKVPFRAYFLSAANFIKGEVLHAPTSNVITGKGGWLYYNNESEDFMNTNALTEEQVRSVCVTLSLIEERIEGTGGKFTFVAMPNKASIYGEYLPDNYKEAPENNLIRIQNMAKDMGLNYTDMRQTLLDNKDKGEGIYHRRDSHWNYMGALIGYDAIMNSLGRDHDPHEGAEYTYEKTWRGDLDKLLYPVGGVMDYQYDFKIDHCDFSFKDPRGVRDQEAQLANFMSDREDKDDFFIVKNRELKDGSKVFMVRDSFGRALLPFVIDCYSESTFKRTDCPDMESLEEGTDMIFEIGERNLAKIISTAPFMYAPVRKGIDINGLKEAGDIRSEAKMEGYGFRISGILPEDSTSEDGRVYIAFEKGKKCFEAFPILEKNLKEEGTKGFSAIISKEELPKDQDEVFIIYGDSIFKTKIR